jgi:uncharacterized protein YndB with AHSA1/START domain
MSDLVSPDISDREIISHRVLTAPRNRVFAAFSDPNQLAQWWGPAGFKNTINEFDFRVGGKWRIVMHAPNGADFANESDFVEIAAPERIVFHHLLPVHWFRMTMIFAGLPDGQTELTWRMVFETAEEVTRLGPFISDANQQNFDRLAAHLTQTR